MAFAEFDTSNLPCVYALFRLISIARYVVNLHAFAFEGSLRDKYEIYREHAA